jgi:hypothetical protein
MPSLGNIFIFFYDLFHGGTYTAAGPSEFQAWTAHLWLWIVIVGYVLSVIGLFVIVYVTMRLFELRRKEEVYYSTLIAPAEAAGGVNPRWEHIESLVHDTNASQWREAIIEADIMLDDALAQRGYVGEGVGEKLKAVDPADMRTLQDAWEVHKVRNQIAHEGSAFDLSELVAQRTIARYEAIFRELKAI